MVKSFKGVYMMYALFFCKSLNGLNGVLSAFKTQKPSKIKGLRGVFWQGLKVLTISEGIYICVIYLSAYRTHITLKTVNPYIYIILY